MTRTVQIFDPAMCCSTGVCGPDVDPALVQFESDLRVLAEKGVKVERFNLGQQPTEFLRHPAVVEALNTGGDAVLPIILVDGIVAWQRLYPSAAELADRLELDLPTPVAEIPRSIPLVMLNVPGLGVIGSSDDDAACTPDSGCC